jgi:hypothetical protein
MSNEDQIRKKFQALRPVMNERTRRLWAASEARAWGWGGVTAVADATGMSRNTIKAGMMELQTQDKKKRGPVDRQPVQRPGGGRKRRTEQDATLLPDLEALLEPVTRGDPQSPLRWTCKSAAKLAAELNRERPRVSARTVSRLLKTLNYSLQSNRKTKEGDNHPDRNAQFEHIRAKTKAFQKRGQPVISIDAKKKELVGDFKNNGREWHPKGQPEKVRVHDFEDKELGKALPYGVYDVVANQGWVSVGIDHDTAEFAVETIRRWWRLMGCKLYPEAEELLIMADGGGSNGSRSRLWKVAVQGLADETGLRISVCHFPPGTSKWNKIEHRMFAYITQNWRGRPLVSHEVIVNLIANTTTQKGLEIRARLDKRKYPTGIKVTDKELAQVQIKKDDFHGEWNYQIVPRRQN